MANTSKKLKKKKATILTISLITATLSISSLLNYIATEQSNIKEYETLNHLYSQSSTTSRDQNTLVSGFQEFININKDFVGWLEVGDFSTPIVQNDNNHKYLTTDFYGKTDPHGTVFADFRNNLTILGDNTILYGHNYDRSQRIFYEVEKFKDLDYANNNPIISFTTLEKEHQFVVFGLFVTNTIERQGDVFDYHNQLHFSTEDESLTFLSNIAKRSLLTPSIPVDYHDRLLTLSTCGYEFEGQRYVLIARELRTSETIQDFTGNIYSATIDPLMPEIWTDIYG